MVFYTGPENGASQGTKHGGVLHEHLRYLAWTRASELLHGGGMFVSQRRYSSRDPAFTPSGGIAA